jgi:hypothetical protein
MLGGVGAGEGDLPGYPIMRVSFTRSLRKLAAREVKECKLVGFETDELSLRLIHSLEFTPLSSARSKPAFQFNGK